MIIHYVSGSRADFGLMQRCLSALDAADGIDLGLVITGQHLSRHYGNTADDIRASGLSIVHEVPVPLKGVSGAEMSMAMANELAGFTEYWKNARPDVVLLLGDRGEMVAAALAAVHLGVFVAHLHGGERSGTLDESFRHVISKLAHYHFPATEDAAERLIKMGEEPSSISVIGAPGLVGITDGIVTDRAWLLDRFGLVEEKTVALVQFHPVVQEAAEAGKQIEILVETVLEAGFSAIVLRPNSDAGGQEIDRYLDSVSSAGSLTVEAHLGRAQYLKTMISSDLVIGNSSSGIIESASLCVSCVNIGTRQDDRLRNDNTIDCREVSPEAIRKAIHSAQALPRTCVNRYGDGKTDRRIVEVIKGLNLHPALLKKRNVY